MKSYRAALLAVLIALPSLMAAVTGYLEARAARERAAIEKAEKQEALDQFGDYIVATLKAGCNP